MNAVTKPILGFKDGRTMGTYEAIVDELADAEPRYGYLRADDLRPLTEAEVRIVYQARAVDMTDAFVKDFDLDNFMEEQPLILAARVSFAREKAARQAIFWDVHQECDRRAQFSEWNR